MAVELEKGMLLLVEGTHDKMFFEALLGTMGMMNIQTLDLAGKNNLRSNLGLIRNHTRFSTVSAIGIIRDADTDPRAAFQAVSGALAANGFDPPAGCLQPTSGPPRISVMIVPSVTRKGSLETICLESAGEQPLMACVRDYFLCAKSCGQATWDFEDKNRMWAYLAGQRDTDMHMGIAATKGYWHWSHAAFKPLKKFLKVAFS